MARLCDLAGVPRTGDPCRDQVAAQVAALQAAAYEWQWIPPRGVSGLKPGPIRRGTAAELLDERNLAWLRRQNALGHGIYVRPAPLSDGTAEPVAFVDDLDAAALARIEADGYRWAALIESSPGRFQGWIRLAEGPLPREVVTACAKALAAEYGGDPSSADWRHYGRAAGFTNTKPERRGDRGAPFCRLVSVWRGVTEAARRLLERVREALSPRRAAAAARRVIEPPAPGAGRLLPAPPVAPSGLAEAFRAAWDGARTRDQSDSARDIAAAIRLIARGADPAAVRAALLAASPRLAERHHDPEDYARRTVQAAVRWVEERRKKDPDDPAAGLSL